MRFILMLGVDFYSGGGASDIHSFHADEAAARAAWHRWLESLTQGAHEEAWGHIVDVDRQEVCWLHTRPAPSVSNGLRSFWDERVPVVLRNEEP